MCVFFFFVSVTLLPLLGRRMVGLSVNLSLPLVLRQALDGGVHHVAPHQTRLWEGLSGPLCQAPSIVL